MSAASEALLQELVDLNQSQAASLRSLAARSGTAGNGGSGDASSGSTGSVLGGVFKTVSSVISGTFLTAIGLAGAGLNKLVQTGSALAANQMALSQGAIEGTNSLSSLTEGLRNLPFGLGLVAEAMTYNTKKLESNLRVYDQISDVGARLGGNLTEVRTAAMSMGLGMDEFANIMKQNGPQLRFMGATADEGAKNLIKFNSTLIKGEVGKGLLGMGYSLTEANNLLGQYSASVGGLNANQMQDQSKMTKTVQLFAEELDASAQLEGKSRQQKAEEMKEAAANAAVNAKLASMTEEEKAKYQQAYNSAMRIGGKGAADALQSQMLGLPPMTKAAQQFTAANAEAAATVRDQAAIIEDGSTAQEARTKLDKLDAKGRKESADFYEKNKTVMNAQIMAGGALAETATAGAKSYGELKRQGLDTEEQIIAQKDKIRKEQEKAKDSAAGDAAQAQARAKFAGTLMDMLVKALTPLFPVITFLTDAFAKFAPKVIGFAGDFIENVMVPFFNKIFASLTLADFVTPFKESFEKVSAALGTIVNSLSDALGGGTGTGAMIGTVFKALMSSIGSVAEIIGDIVVQFAKSDLFQNLKTYFMKVVHIVEGIVEVVSSIIKSPFGTWLAGALFSVVDLFMSPFKLFIDVVDSLVDLVFGFVKLFQGDSVGAIKLMMSSITKLLNGIMDWFLRIPSLVLGIFGMSDLAETVKKAAHELVDNIGGFLTSVFTSGAAEDAKQHSAEAKKKETAAPASPTTPASKSTPQPAPTLEKEKAEKAKAAEEKAKAEKSAYDNAPNPASTAVPIKSKDPVEILTNELQLLNKQFALLLQATRDTSDNTRRTKDLMAAGGNRLKG